MPASFASRKGQIACRKPLISFRDSGYKTRSMISAITGRTQAVESVHRIFTGRTQYHFVPTTPASRIPGLPGLHPNNFKTMTVSMTLLSLPSVCLRSVSRRTKAQQLWWDDSLILTSMVRSLKCIPRVIDLLVGVERDYCRNSFGDARV